MWSTPSADQASPAAAPVSFFKRLQGKASVPRNFGSSSSAWSMSALMHSLWDAVSGNTFNVTVDSEPCPEARCAAWVAVDSSGEVVVRSPGKVIGAVASSSSSFSVQSSLTAPTQPESLRALLSSTRPDSVGLASLCSSWDAQSVEVCLLASGDIIFDHASRLPLSRGCSPSNSVIAIRKPALARVSSSSSNASLSGDIVSGANCSAAEQQPQVQLGTTVISPALMTDSIGARATITSTAMDFSLKKLKDSVIAESGRIVSGMAARYGITLASLPVAATDGATPVDLRIDASAVLGRGGFAAVYAATLNGKPVAVKVVNFTALGIKRSRMPHVILQEVAHAVALSHTLSAGGGKGEPSADSGIVRLLHWDVQPIAGDDELPPLPPLQSSSSGASRNNDGLPAASSAHTHRLLLVMPRLGITLQAALRVPRRGEGPPSILNLPMSALQAAVDASRSLALLHARGILHGDVKASNLMFDDSGDRGGAPATVNSVAAAEGGLRKYLDGVWRWVDLGLCASLRKGAEDAACRGHTKGHAAPELMAGGRLTRGSDVFALGVVLQALLQPLLKSCAQLTKNSASACDLTSEVGAAIAALSQLQATITQCSASEVTARPTTDHVAAVISAALVAWPVIDQQLEQQRSTDSAVLMECSEEEDGPTFSTITTEEGMTESSSSSAADEEEAGASDVNSQVVAEIDLPSSLSL